MACWRGPETKEQDRGAVDQPHLVTSRLLQLAPRPAPLVYHTLDKPQPPAWCRALHPTAAGPEKPGPLHHIPGTLSFRRAASQRLPPSLLGRPPSCAAPCPERTRAGLPKTRAPPKVLQGPPGSPDIHRHHVGGGARAEMHDEPGQKPHGGTGGRDEPNQTEPSRAEPS